MILRERLRPADWVMITGSSVLLASTFLSWYQLSFSYAHWTTAVDRTMAVSGWDGTKLSLFVIIFALAVLALILLVRSGSRLLPSTMPYEVIVTAISFAAFVTVLIKVFVHEANLRVSYGIFLSLAASVAMIFGGIMLYRERSAEIADGE